MTTDKSQDICKGDFPRNSSCHISTTKSGDVHSVGKGSLTAILELAQKQSIENDYEAIQPPERRGQDQPRKNRDIGDTPVATKALTTALKPEVLNPMPPDLTFLHVMIMPGTLLQFGRHKKAAADSIMNRPMCFEAIMAMVTDLPARSSIFFGLRTKSERPLPDPSQCFG